MFSNDPYVHEMYQMLLGDNVHWQDREAWIYSKDVYTRYPVPGRAVRPAARGDQGVHRRGHRSALRQSAAAKKPAADNGTNGDYTGARAPAACSSRCMTGRRRR